MKTAPEESNLLDDLLDESAPAVDSLGPVLRAVRARRRRRETARVATAVLAVAVVWSSLSGLWRGRPDREVVEFARPAPAKPLVQRVHSRALTGSERVLTGDNSDLIVRVQTGLERGLRATDGELLALAGGRGVGLFRFPDRAELLLAGPH